MAREVTQRQRAAIALLEQMGLYGHPAASQFVGDILAALKTARQEALREAAKVAKAYIKARDDSRYMSESEDCERWKASYRVYADAADALDRLASEGG